MGDRCQNVVKMNKLVKSLFIYLSLQLNKSVGEWFRLINLEVDCVLVYYNYEQKVPNY